MPIVKEPHFCQPPIWPRLYRLNTVWRCPRCKQNFRIEQDRRLYGRPKRWIRLDTKA